MNSRIVDVGNVGYGTHKVAWKIEISYITGGSNMPVVRKTLFT
jgi:hypothetical protein